MRIRIFTLKFHAATEQFDDEELQEFIKDKDVLSIREHFFVKHETPYLALLVTYLPGTPAPVRGKKKRELWREMLSNEQMPLFETLRSWRAERAERDAVPPFVICGNLELVHMIRERPTSLAGLMKIRGFGKAKTEKYGKQLLALLSSSSNITQDEKQKDEQASGDQQQTRQQNMFDAQAEQRAAELKKHAERSKAHEKVTEG